MLFDLFISVALALPISASKSANDPDCGLRSNAGFVAAQKGLEDLGMPVSILGAVATVWINGARCSASYISDEGDMLLASHCLEKCAGADNKSWKNTPNPSLKCQVNIDGQKTTAEVLAMSRCKALDDIAVSAAPLIGEKVPAKLKGCGNAGDLAVIRPQKPPQNFSCLSLGRGRPSLGDGVFTIGQPGKTQRPGNENADGDSKVLSVGKVTQDKQCYEGGHDPSIWKRMFGEKSVPPTAHQLGPWTEYLSTRMIQTGADIVPGSSGGPLLNSRGEIIGVASNFDPKHSNDRECRGAQFFDSIARLRMTEESWRNKNELSKLNCSKRHALAHGA